MFFSRNRKKLNPKKTMERVKQEKRLDLEKGDLTAILIAAFITFVPMILVLAGVVFFAFWLFVGRF